MAFPNGAVETGVHFLALKDISSWETFDGTDDAWDSWSFATRALLNSLGWKESLDLAAEHPNVILRENLSGDIGAISDNLFLLLARKCRGKALSIVKLSADQCGFEVWRALSKEYEPEGQSRITPCWRPSCSRGGGSRQATARGLSPMCCTIGRT